MSTVATLVRDDDLYEVIEGARVLLSALPIFSAVLATQLGTSVGDFADRERPGRVMIQGLFHLPAPVNRDRRPDVAFVSYQRWPKTRSVPRTDNAWDVVPNLTTEVVSPTNSAEDLEQKTAEYFKVGVELVWIVYPSQSKIHVYTSPTQIQVITLADTLDGGTVLPGFRLALTELFAEPAEDGVTH